MGKARTLSEIDQSITATTKDGLGGSMIRGSDAADIPTGSHRTATHFVNVEEGYLGDKRVTQSMFDDKGNPF
jgi:hypothetical protein